MWARNFFKNIKDNIDLGKLNSRIKLVAGSTLATHAANTIITSSITRMFDQFGKDQIIKEKQSRIDALQLRVDETNPQERLQKNRIDKLTDELRDAERKKIEIEFQLLKEETNFKACIEEREVFMSAYQKSWLCLYKPYVAGKITNDEVFLASNSKNK